MEAFVNESATVQTIDLGESCREEEDKDLWCLGFVDRSENPRSTVVIGGHQMEDNQYMYVFA